MFDICVSTFPSPKIVAAYGLRFGRRTRPGYEKASRFSELPWSFDKRSSAISRCLDARPLLSSTYKEAPAVTCGGPASRLSTGNARRLFYSSRRAVAGAGQPSSEGRGANGGLCGVRADAE